MCISMLVPDKMILSDDGKLENRHDLQAHGFLWLLLFFDVSPTANRASIFSLVGVTHSMSTIPMY